MPTIPRSVCSPPASARRELGDYGTMWSTSDLGRDHAGRRRISGTAAIAKASDHANISTITKAFSTPMLIQATTRFTDPKVARCPRSPMSPAWPMRAAISSMFMSRQNHRSPKRLCAGSRHFMPSRLRSTVNRPMSAWPNVRPARFPCSMLSKPGRKTSGGASPPRWAFPRRCNTA